MTRLVEVVRIYEPFPAGRWILCAELEPGFEIQVCDPSAVVTVGYALLYEDLGALHDTFDTNGLPPTVPGTRMRGFALRIRLAEDAIPKGDDLLTTAQPVFFRGFQALNRLFEIYRLSKFQLNPQLTIQGGKGPWLWLDPGAPDTFSDFLESSYAVFEVEGARVVEAGLLHKSHIVIQEESQKLRVLIRRNIEEIQDPSRLLLLNAWAALYDGNIRAAVTLANAALETKTRRILITKMGGDQVPAKKIVDALQGHVPFLDQIRLLLPLVGVHLKIDKKALQTLRESRTQVVHKGRERPQQWEDAIHLLLSAEQAFAALDAADPSTRLDDSP